MPRFTDKVVIVTGASSGIGHAAARAFAREGATLVLAARSEERLRQLAATIERRGGRALALPTDVTDRGQVFRMAEAALASYGHIDILVNNAGIGLRRPVVEMEAADLRRVIEVNLYGSIWCAQAVLPEMIRRRSGQIINISSVVGKRALPGMAAYCASKFAVQAFSESLRVEAAPYNIDVIVVCPTRTVTAFGDTPLMAGGGAMLEGYAGMPAERVADIIVRASVRRKREVVISLSGKALAWCNALTPGLMDRAIARVSGRLARETGASSEP